MPLPPPVYFGGRHRRRSLLFICLLFLVSFSSSLLPSPRVSNPSLPSLPPSSSKPGRLVTPPSLTCLPPSSPLGASIGCRGPVNQASPPRGQSTPPSLRARSSPPLPRLRIVAASWACKPSTLHPRAERCALRLLVATGRRAPRSWVAGIARAQAAGLQRPWPGGEGTASFRRGH